MQAGPVAVEWAVLQDTHLLTRRDGLAHGDRGAHRLVGGADRRSVGSGEFDADDTAAGDLAGEHDRAGRGSHHRVTRLGCQVHSSVTGPPGGRRWFEEPEDQRSRRTLGAGHGPGAFGWRAATGEREQKTTESEGSHTGTLPEGGRSW